MNKNLLKIAFIALFGIGIGYNAYISNQKHTLSDISITNIEALAQENSETGSNTTWQVGSKKITTTTSPGWSYDVSGGFWIFQGKRSTSYPPSTSEVTIKCCRPQGDQASCAYESC